MGEPKNVQMDWMILLNTKRKELIYNFRDVIKNEKTLINKKKIMGIAFVCVKTYSRRKYSFGKINYFSVLGRGRNFRGYEIFVLHLLS